MIGVQFQPFGPWVGATAAIESLPLLVRSSAIWGMRKSAEKLVKIVRGHIDSQDLNWPALSVRTNSGDPRVLVDTEQYRNSIKAYKVGNTYYAGVKPTAINDRGIRISEYAQIHEIGGKNIPARPLWGPSFEEMNGTAGIKAIVMGAIYSKLKVLESQGIEVRMRDIL